MSGPRTVVFKVTYARVRELRADVDQQLLRGGLLIKVTDLSGLTLDLPVRLELVLPDGSALHGDATVLQVLAGFGVAVSASAELVDELARHAARLANHRDAPGAGPARYERHDIDTPRAARATTTPPPTRTGSTTRPQVAHAHSAASAPTTSTDDSASPSAAPRPTPAPFARPVHLTASSEHTRPPLAPFARPAHLTPPPDAQRPTPPSFARPAHVMASPGPARPTPAPFARPAHTTPPPDAQRPTPQPFARPAHTMPPARPARPTPSLPSAVVSAAPSGARTQPATVPPKPDGPTRAEKIQLALHGSRDERNAILRDRDRTLHPFVLKNPQLDADDALAIAKNAQLNPDVLKLLGERKDWVQRPTIALALAKNPKTPPELAVRVLEHLSIEALRQLAKGVGVLPHVTQAARRKLLG